MRYLDVCAGISASSVAWKPLGWEAAAYSEIEAAPRAVLQHRQGALPVGWDHRHVAGWNTTPLFGDFTQIEAHHVGPIDLLVGGTPCQDFSVAGLRAGLDGDRGNLSLEFLRLADRTRPRWVVWENVPGVLSINGGRAFGAILGGLGELGYGFAYRVLDAQHFGVPQRHRRVFVVGYLGDHRRAGAVLFERDSMSGHPAPRREARAGVADDAPLGAGGASYGAGWQANGRASAQAFGGGANCQATNVATAVTAHPGGRYDLDCETFVAAALTSNGVGTCGADDNQAQAHHLAAHSLRGEGFDASEDGTGRGAPLVPVAASAVRRLTPRECERLQGFPDDYTLVPNRGKPMADGPRYKCLGNSMAVPVMRWIGERIAAVNAIPIDQKDAA